MEQYGVVLEERGELALVAIQRHLSCEKCGRCGILGDLGKKVVKIEAVNKICAGPGQRVVLVSDHRRVLFASFLLYLVPLGALLAGMVFGHWLVGILDFTGNRDMVTLFSGLTAMAFIYLVIRLWDRKNRDSYYYKPVIDSLLEDSEKEQGGFNKPEQVKENEQEI